MLDELIDSSAVRLQANGTIRAMARTVAAPKMKTRDINDLGEKVSALLGTICSNVESHGRRLLVSSTSRRRVDRRIAGLFLDRVERDGSALLQGIEDQLAHPPRGFIGKGRNRGPRFGVTLFVHQDDTAT
jgi:hypothetical protein